MPTEQKNMLILFILHIDLVPQESGLFTNMCEFIYEQMWDTSSFKDSAVCNG